MKKRMMLFGVLTLMGTGAALAFPKGNASQSADKSFCGENCPPECCVTGKAAPACCYDPSCCE